MMRLPALMICRTFRGAPRGAIALPRTIFAFLGGGGGGWKDAPPVEEAAAGAAQTSATRTQAYREEEKSFRIELWWVGVS